MKSHEYQQPKQTCLRPRKGSTRTQTYSTPHPPQKAKILKYNNIVLVRQGIIACMVTHKKDMSRS